MHGLHDHGILVRLPVGQEICLLCHFTNPTKPSTPTRLPIQWGPTALSPGVKQQEREAVHSSASVAEVNIKWSYISFLPYRFPIMT